MLFVKYRYSVLQYRYLVPPLRYKILRKLLYRCLPSCFRAVVVVLCRENVAQAEARRLSVDLGRAAGDGEGGDHAGQRAARHVE